MCLFLSSSSKLCLVGNILDDQNRFNYWLLFSGISIYASPGSQFRMSDLENLQRWDNNSPSIIALDDNKKVNFLEWEAQSIALQLASKWGIHKKKEFLIMHDLMLKVCAWHNSMQGHDGTKHQYSSRQLGGVPMMWNHV